VRAKVAISNPTNYIFLRSTINTLSIEHMKIPYFQSLKIGAGIPIDGLSGRSGILLVICNRVIIAHYWIICYILMVFSSISFKPQKVQGLIAS